MKNYTEAIKIIRQWHLPEGDNDWAYLDAIELAISALERCKRIDEKKPSYYDPREDMCDEDIAYERGWNDCLRWVKGI